VSAKLELGLASNLLLGGTHEVRLKTRIEYKTNAKSFGSLSGLTPKLVSGLESRLLLWGTREASLYGLT
jgi:hypothetical protein